MEKVTAASFASYIFYMHHQQLRGKDASNFGHLAQYHKCSHKLDPCNYPPLSETNHYCFCRFCSFFVNSFVVCLIVISVLSQEVLFSCFIFI